MAVGDLSHTVRRSLQSSDQPVDDRATTQWLRLFVEATRRIGGGLSVEAALPADVPSSGPAAELSTFHLHPFLAFRVGRGARFRMPIRVGPFLDRVTVADSSFAGIRFGDRRITLYGARISVEPEYRFAGAWTAFVHLGYGYGLGETKDAFDEAETDGQFVAAEAGVRFRTRRWRAALAFVLRRRDVMESRGSTGANPGFRFGETDVGFAGVLAEFGVRW